MEEKKCPVDRGKLLIGLECCRLALCKRCPYRGQSGGGGCRKMAEDAYAYVLYLEERLGVTG